MIDTKSILEHVNIVDVIRADIGEPIKESGRYLFWHCPFHTGDNSPSLAATPDNGRWHCFGCGKSGDAIGWKKEYCQMSFREACEKLNNNGPSNPVNCKKLNSFQRQLEKPLPDELQQQWKSVIETCERSLWDNGGQSARDYLHNRGLKDETLQLPFFRVGYSPGMKIEGVWVERGIVLPCFTVKPNLDIDYVQYIKIRRPGQNPKYKKLSGQGSDLSGLFGAHWLPGSDIVFMVEGEFDVLLLLQEAGDLVGAATLGKRWRPLQFWKIWKIPFGSRAYYYSLR